MNAQIKMELLKKLMNEMDDSIMSKIPSKSKGEPAVQVTEIEQKEMPISDLKDKMSSAMGGKDEEMKESETEKNAVIDALDKVEAEEPDDDMTDSPDDSSLMRRMKEAKRAKMMKAG